MIKKPPRIPKNINPQTNRISGEIIDAAYKVHFALGPGLLESVYETCLCHKIRQKGLKTERQVSLPIVFEGIHLDDGLKLDLVVEKKVVVELKAVETILPVHEAQLITYLKLSGMELGLLINFNVPILKKGIKRIALSNPN
jgi:GxxExxY protein